MYKYTIAISLKNDNSNDFFFFIESLNLYLSIKRPVQRRGTLYVYTNNYELKS